MYLRLLGFIGLAELAGTECSLEVHRLDRAYRASRAYGVYRPVGLIGFVGLKA